MLHPLPLSPTMSNKRFETFRLSAKLVGRVAEALPPTLWPPTRGLSQQLHHAVAVMANATKGFRGAYTSGPT